VQQKPPKGGQAITDKVVTNYHVIEGAASGYAKIVGMKSRYTVAGYVAVDEQHDLAILQLADANAPALPLADGSRVVVGDEVFAVGSPYGLEGTLSRGIVSGIRDLEREPNSVQGALASTSVSSKPQKDRMFQITAPISPGSSGGPILDTQGKVIGVAVATFKDGQNLNFAVPVSYLDSLLSASTETKKLQAQAKKVSSVFDVLRKGEREPVVGTLFSWEVGGTFSFSLRNNLQRAITNIVCLVVFYDLAGQPIDVSIVKCKNAIPPGLAKRTGGSVDSSVERLNSPISPSELDAMYGRTTNPSLMPKPLRGKIEFRILDFTIVESGDLF
jgi:hypothetical protein